MRDNHVSRPPWLRRTAVAMTSLFAWSTVLALPVQALAHPPPQTRPGLRTLTTEEMQRIFGRQGGGGGLIHPTSVAEASGSTFAWEAEVGGTNTGNGNKLIQIPIVGWTARGGLPIAFTLAHNSQSVHNGELGQKWTHSFDLYLVSGTNSTTGDPIMTVHWGDDLAYAFGQNVDGSYSAPTGIHDTLVKNSDNTYTLTTPQQTKYHYKTNLYCDSITDKNANAITIGYTSGNYVSTITDPTSRTIDLSYDSSNRISTITDPLSRVWTCSYDSNGNLSSIALPTLNSTSYSLSFSYNSVHDITDLQSAAGRHQTFGYNTNNTLAWEKDGVLNQTSYSYTSTATTITDTNSHTTVYTYASGRLTQVKDSLNDHEDYSYDSANNRTQITDKRGYSSTFTFDSNGNMLTASDPYSNTVTNTFNSHNDLLTLSRPE